MLGILSTIKKSLQISWSQIEFPNSEDCIINANKREDIGSIVQLVVEISQGVELIFKDK